VSVISFTKSSTKSSSMSQLSNGVQVLTLTIAFYSELAVGC